MSIERTILTNLLVNEEYFRQVFPFIKKEYFPRGPIRLIYGLIQDHYNKHKVIPSKNALAIAMDRKSVSQVEYDDVISGIEELNGVPEDLGWLLSESEKYCQERAMQNALSRAIEIQENFEKPLDERDPKMPEIGAIQDLMKEALSVSFSFDVGHDYWDDIEARWQSYKTKARKLPFSIKILNTITKGGIERKTLNLIMAGVNVGKSLGLCHLAVDYMLQGFNVLYVSMEMAEEAVGKRIDANLIDVSMDDIEDGLISEQDFYKKLKVRSEKGCGKLVIRQFPTGGANVNHLHNLMQDLKLKKNFIPDIVIVDYLGIMASSRMKFTENSYTMVKAIAEELRGFAIEHNVAVWSAAQTTRSGWDNLDVQMGDIAESAGLAATADFILAAMEGEDMAELGQQKFKQIKSRYGDKSKFNSFILGVCKGKQRWFELECMGGESADVATERMQEQYKENLSTKAKMVALASMDDVEETVDWGV